MNQLRRYSEAVRRYSPYETVQYGQEMNGLLDTFTNLIDKGTTLYNQNSALLDPIRNNAISTVVQSYAPKSKGTAQGQFATPAIAAPDSSVPAANSPMSTGVKVAIGVASAAAIGGLFWALSSPKKNAA